MSTQEWIDLESAIKIEGSPSTTAFSQWARSWNRRPDTQHKILRRKNRVERHSLEAALLEDAKKFDRDGEVTNSVMASPLGVRGGH